MPFVAWIMMFEGVSGLLSSRGWGSLKYFTVLSNLLEGITSGIWLAGNVQHAGWKGSHRAEVLKYIACLCVFLTFATVMLFLGPVFGYHAMFTGGNLYFHLVIPVVAILEMIFLVRETFSVKENILAVIPVICYGCVYLGNILINGRGDSVSGWNDFYGFTAWGLPAGIGIFAGICIVVFVAGTILRNVTKRRC